MGTSISVATPEGGIYMEDVYPNSGKVVARKLVTAPDPLLSRIERLNARQQWLVDRSKDSSLGGPRHGMVRQG